jgi:hypothetical protein
MIDIKACRKCERVKSLIEFHKSKGNKYGRATVCKQCRSVAKGKQKERIELEKQNKKRCGKCEKIKLLIEFNKVRNGYSNVCKLCRKIFNHQYYLENRDRIKQQTEEYYRNNRERCRENYKVYYSKNKNKIIRMNQKWIVQNKGKVQHYKNNYKLRKRRTMEFRLKERIACSIRNYLYRFNMNKNNIPYSEFINFTIYQLMIYLESQFDNKTNWANYGSYWHIDHVLPLSLYDYSDINEIKKSWDLRNLRPLGAKANLSKNNKLDWNLVKQYNLYDVLPKALMKVS